MRTASKREKSATVRLSKARAAARPPSSSTADRRRPSSTNHAVNGSTRAASASSRGMRAALARQSTWKRSGYPTGCQSASVTSCPASANHAAAVENASRAAASRTMSSLSSQGDTVVMPTRRGPGSRRAASTNGPDPGAPVAYGNGARPTRASSSRAASSTVRAIGPVTDSWSGESSPEPIGSRPREGLSPTTPTVAEGMRIDPPPSEPTAAGSRPAATATAAPPLEPPAPAEGRHGSRAGAWMSGSVNPVSPNSEVLVLPTLTAPASSSARARGSDAVGT